MSGLKNLVIVIETAILMLIAGVLTGVALDEWVRNRVYNFKRHNVSYKSYRDYHKKES